ncbi:MAG: potassium channel protein [Acidobacteriia bacterium]|nr:potassium channel protein [Terriglobia bacterium]
MHPLRRLLPAGLLLLIIVVVGISGYILIEGWNLLDSTYMVVITLFTIGFQEVHPLSHAGEIFTMFIAVSGVGTAVYAGGRAVEIIVEGEMSGYRKRKRMNQRIREMSQHYIICGYGRVGHQVSQVFASSKVPFVVIDSKPETTAELELKGAPHIIGDATSDETLLQAGIKTAKGLVACSDSDVANVYVTLSARALNPGLRIVARAGLRDTEKKLLMAGADRVISPYFISGLRMAALATRPVTSDFLDLVTHGGQVEYSLFELAVSEHSALVGKSLEEADIRGVAGALVLAMRKADGSFNLQPKAASKVEKGSVLVVLGTQEQIEVLERMVK